MKRIIEIFGLLTAMSMLANAWPEAVEPFVIAAVPTNATAQASGMVTNAPQLSGYIDYVAFDITKGNQANAATCTVIVATVGGSATGGAQTILTITALTADGIYFPVVPCSGSDGTSTNMARRIPLFADKLTISAYNANSTTNTIALKAYVGLTALP